MRDVMRMRVHAPVLATGLLIAVLLLPPGSVACVASAHETELPREKQAVLRRLFAAGDSSRRVASGADVQAARTALSAITGPELVHLAQSDHSHAIPGAPETWVRSLALAVHHDRAWGRRLGVSASTCAELGDPDGSPGRVLASAARFIDRDEIVSSIEALSRHWTPECRALAGHLICVYAHLGGPRSDRRTRWMHDVMRRLLRDDDPQVIASVASPVAHARVPATLKLLADRLEDDRPVDAQVDGVLGRTGETVAQSCETAVLGFFHYSAMDLAAKPPLAPREAIAKWLRANESTTGLFDPGPSWEAVLDAQVRLLVNKPQTVDSPRGKATLSLESWSLGWKDGLPVTTYQVRVSWEDGLEAVNAPLKSELNWPVTTSYTVAPEGLDGPLEVKIRSVAAPSTTEDAARVHVSMWMNREEPSDR